ncbi:acyl-CoA dehydrogenase family protein [Cumulibacter manganitolerans]|uniref:acyl-CoA dehydrogenase family protein n=1 Tax=Cumulibacter manganitolerans TaxID=1884992 RepID=UPI001295A4CF|nr:acyl-CoA dehydrogenase family protein [Cumulibacter manganitolerans]
MPATHDVLNQAEPLVEYDAAAIDTPLQDAVRRLADDATADSLSSIGRRLGDPHVQQWGIDANAYPPVLRTHDRYGNRINEVDFHPAWHHLMDVAVTEGLHGAPWVSDGPAPHLRRAAGFYVWSQNEAGHGCPISMTYAIVPALRANDELARQYEPGLTSSVYEPGLRDPALKQGLLAGMGMTEKQGGSDVRANTTRAVAAEDGSWRITGHKWFTSAPMCDLFLILAQVDGAGVSCFLVPRVLPGGERNVFNLQRLKDKLGNKSNASSEVEFDQTVGWLVGDAGRGVQTIIEMVSMTRLDCVIGSTACQRAALVQAVHHARHRKAFGATLSQQPLMQEVLADVALEVEAATALMTRLAAAVDRGEHEFSRLAVAAGKFWVCKRAPHVVAEALECLGGNGYVEESGMPRLFRESPLNSIWEGSGNVISLDVLRAMGREPESVSAVTKELALAAGADRRLDAHLERLQLSLQEATPRTARRVAQDLALGLQGALLVQHAPAYVADAFCATRLDGDWGHVFGTLPASVDAAAIIERAFPS